MRYSVLACDYDGTLAHDGIVDFETVAALKRFAAGGRKLILVTGRELEQLESIFPQMCIFDRVVIENGAALFRPATKELRMLCAPPPDRLVSTLKARGVAPLSTGRVIVATWRPHETVVLQTIRDLKLEMQVIFNKDAVMALPSGVNKATGLTAALAELGLRADQTVGVGDAENDHSFLRLCALSAAVANALPAIKSEVNVVLRGDHGAGVREMIDKILKDDPGAANLATVPQGSRQ
jgi:hydroxymethylpyrimidine pyrophosphatase-like HAD family hydrolase